MNNNLIYLACPYRHEDVRIERLRYEQVSWVTAHLINQGVLVFSPIVNSHDIYSRGLIKGDDGILDWDVRFLGHCDELWVLCLDGWKDSVGVTAEVGFAEQANKPVHYHYLDKYYLENVNPVYYLED